MRFFIEVNDAGEIFHVGKIMSNPGEETTIIEPENCLIIDEKYETDFDHFINGHALMKKVYKYQAGKIKKKGQNEVTIGIAEWVDDHPMEITEEKDSSGFRIANPKAIDDYTPEELNDMATPIPTFDDFNELPDDFIKKDKYQAKVQQ